MAPRGWWPGVPGILSAAWWGGGKLGTDFQPASGEIHQCQNLYVEINVRL